MRPFSFHTFIAFIILLNHHESESDCIQRPFFSFFFSIHLFVCIVCIFLTTITVGLSLIVDNIDFTRITFTYTASPNTIVIFFVSDDTSESEPDPG